MLNFGLLLLFLHSSPVSVPDSEELLIQQIADSGQCADLAESPDRRVTPPPAIAPGQPPVLSFRFYEGKMHHRFGNADLMLDDAGH